MRKNVLKALPELLSQGVIDEATAKKIEAYYLDTTTTGSQKILLIFAILGALLVGMGIILIIAHNWDSLSTAARLVLSFTPLFLTQLLLIYFWIKKSSSQPLTESVSILNFFAVPVCLSLISQIYHMASGLDAFLLTWLFLTWPLIFFPGSKMVRLLFIIVATWYGCELRYFTFEGDIPMWFLPLIAIPFLHFIFQNENKAQDYLTAWLLGISITIMAGAFIKSYHWLLFPLYILLFSIFYLSGQLYSGNRKKLFWQNPWLSFGQLGFAICCFLLAYDFYWNSKPSAFPDLTTFVSSPEVVQLIFFIFLLSVGIHLLIRYKGWKYIFPELSGSLIMIILIFIFFTLPIPFKTGVIAANIILFTSGVFYLVMGIKEKDFARTNFGLICICAITIARFFDQDISFIIRGLVFILMGAGFFTANYFIVKKQKTT
ncbi:MAG: DUF2157 domain-containing protein [Cyclobacteriaceae bacterium]|nr:DUF2157 domain-containing protein [Cyclobacteriaceae bacterium]